MTIHDKDLTNLNAPIIHEYPSKHKLKQNFQKGEYQPTRDIVNNVTEDEDDKKARHMAGAPSDVTNIYDAESFLDRYETMVREQEIEYMATLSYLRPLLKNMQELAQPDVVSNRASTTQNYSNTDDDGDGSMLDFSYKDLKCALKNLDMNPAYNFMKADKQFLLALHILTDDAGRLVDGRIRENDRITWIEIIQCYRICVVGMQTLEQIPEPREIRVRARVRSMSMMSLFKSRQDCVPEALPSPNETGRVLPRLSIGDSKWRDSILASRYMLMIFALLMLSVFALLRPLLGPLRANSTPRDFSTTPLVDVPVMPNTIATLESVTVNPIRQDSVYKHGPVFRSLPSTPFQPRVGGHRRAQYPKTFETRNSLQKSPSQLPISAGPIQSSNNKPPTNVYLSTPLADGVAVGFATVSLGLLVPVLSSTSFAIPTGVAPLLSIGATVVAATLAAHGLRSLIASWYGKLMRLEKEG